MVKPEPLLLQKNLGCEVATFFQNFTKIKNLPDVCVGTHRFFVVHFNFFIRTTAGFAVPAELGMAQFSVQDGILDVFSTILNLCEMPKGYSFQAKEQSEKTHRIPVPPPNGMRDVITDPRDLLRTICNFIRGVALDTAVDLEEEVIALFSKTPLFTLAEDRAIITEGFDAIMGEAGFESKVPVMLLPVEGLFVHLLKLANQEQDCKPLRVASKMADLFNPDRLKNHMKLACPFHVEEADDAEFCSLARVKRWVFELTAPVCSLLDIPLEEDKHWPRGVQRLSGSALEGGSSKGDFGASHFGDGGRVRSPSPQGRRSRERLMSRRSRDRDSPEYREYKGKRERRDSRSSRERHGDRDRDSPRNKSDRKSSDKKKSSSSRRSHDNPDKWSRSRRSRERSSERREEKYRLKLEPHSIPPLMCEDYGAAGPSHRPTKQANEKKFAPAAPRLTAVQREPEESASVPSKTPSPHQQQDRRASAGKSTAVSSVPAVPDGGSRHVESALQLRHASPMHDPYPCGASSVSQPAGPPQRPISGAQPLSRELSENLGRSYEIPYRTASVGVQELSRHSLRVINPLPEFTLSGGETFSHPGMPPVGTQQPSPGVQQGTFPLSGSTLNFGGGNGILQMSAAGVGTQQPSPGVHQGTFPLSGATLNLGGGRIFDMSPVGAQQPSPGVLQGTSPTVNLGGGSRTIQTSPAHGGVPHQTSPGGQQGFPLFGPTVNLGGGNRTLQRMSPASVGMQQSTAPGPVLSTNNSPPGSAPVRTSMFQDVPMMHTTVDPAMSQGAWYYVPAGGIPPGAVGPHMAPSMAPSAAGPHMMPPPSMAPSAAGAHMMPPNPYMMPPNLYMGHTAMNYGHTGYLPPGIHPYQVSPPANYMPAPNPYPVATTSAPASNHMSSPNPCPVASTSAPAATHFPAPNPIPGTVAANHPAPNATLGRMDMFSSPDALRTTPASAPSQGLAAPRPVDAEGRTLLSVEVSGVSDGGPAETVQVKQEPVSRIRGENPHGVAWQLQSFSGGYGT